MIPTSLTVENNPVQPPRYLAADSVEELGRMVLALTAEVWQLKDRTLVLEQLLQERGVLGAGEIDAYQPDAALAAHLLTARGALVRRVLGAIAPADKRVEAELAATVSR
jgi:hypothetical protein